MILWVSCAQFHKWELWNSPLMLYHLVLRRACLHLSWHMLLKAKNQVVVCEASKEMNYLIRQQHLSGR